MQLGWGSKMLGFTGLLHGLLLGYTADPTNFESYGGYDLPYFELEWNPFSSSRFAFQEGVSLLSGKRPCVT